MGRAPFQVLVFPFRRNQAGRLEYAIFRRTDLDLWQGIAGGGEDDESPMDAAAREAREEAGITGGPLLQLSTVGAVTVEHFRDRHLWDPRLRQIPEHAFGVPVDGAALSISPEHREFVWLPVEDALVRLEWESNRTALRELHRRLLAEHGRTSATPIEIRNETPDDVPAIREVNDRAFGGPAEGRLVEILRVANKALISLVALYQDQVVGHVLFSPVSVAEAPERFRAAGLAPMSVLPEFQNRGIGSRLVREGLEACIREGHQAVVVLGHPRYYPRFGFLVAKDYGLENEYDAVDSFMVMALQKGVLRTIRGLVKYAPEFRDAGC